LSEQNPRVKAYFSDVYDYESGSFSPNEGESRLDATLDKMQKDGSLKPDEREDVKSDVLRYWENGSVPPEISAPAKGPESSNESLFKIGKLITRR
jgi:hypothetical protein